jgi:hypothetical protein
MEPFTEIPEKSHGQAPAEGSFSATMQSTNVKLQDAYKEMIAILIKAGVKKAPEWGPFFADFRRVAVAKEKFNAENLAKIMGAMDVSAEMVTLSDDMKEAMKAQTDWLQFLTNHSEGGVPMDDPSGWTATKLHEFLNKHGLAPPMSTPNDVLVQVACHMATFSHCCLVLLNNSVPDDEHAEALGRQSMGQATERDREVIAQKEASSKKGEALNCPGCGKSAKKLCANCKDIAYCGRDCQVSCWKEHKPNCKAPA